MIAYGISLIHFKSNMHNYSEEWATRKGERAQTEAQAEESGTNRGSCLVCTHSQGLRLLWLRRASAIWQF